MSLSKKQYEEKVKASPFGPQLTSLAETIFALWLDNSAIAYEKPNGWHGTVVNPNLEAEFLMKFGLSIHTWVNMPDEEQQKTDGGAYGFICKHMGENLNVIWFSKYVLGDGKEFQNLVKLTSLRAFVSKEEDVAQRIFQFYEHLLDNFPLGAMVPDIKPENVVSITQHQKADAMRQQAFNDQLGNYFTQLLQTRLLQQVALHKKDCHPDFKQFIDEDALMALLQDNEVSTQHK